MSSLISETALGQIAEETAFFAQAPDDFFLAWKQGVELAGVSFFGDGTSAGLAAATSKWDLVPDLPLIAEALGAMSSGERVFIAAMTSFYNSHDSAQLLCDAGVEGLADLGRLDRRRRQVIATLLLSYTGW